MNTKRLCSSALLILMTMGLLASRLPGPSARASSTPASAESVLTEKVADSACPAATTGYHLFLPLLARSGPGAISASPAPAPQPDLRRSASPRDLPSSSFAAATGFLYQGENPIQVGVRAGVIDPLRAAVLRGRTCARDGAPLAGVSATILNHPEFGSTTSQSDGLFDIGVNGGGLLTVVYTRSGYLPLQRQVRAPTQDYAWLPDVVLSPLDPNVTAIDLSSATPVQVARGSVVSDADGTRRQTLLFPLGTTASMTLSDGTTQPLTTLHVRATEYTVGANGQQAMPGDLPPSSGYTYSPEFSVDEAIAVNAIGVQFSQPVISYNENFLNFPVGMIVPVGYYDRQQGIWAPSLNGRVVKVLSISGGMADLDTDGDSAADNGVSLGVTAAERQTLATLYGAGQTLWRVPVMHFSPWDCNWPYGPPSGADAPKNPPPLPREPDDCPDCGRGSIIEIQNQTLGEGVPVSGTPYRLHYASDRVPGRRAAYTLDIPLSGAALPPGLKRIDLQVFVAGQRFTQSFPASPNQRASYVWDGKDGYGRTLNIHQRATVRIGYAYNAVYQTPAQSAQAFGALSGIPISANPARGEVTLWQEWRTTVGGWDARSQGLGGWTLDVQHRYDPVGQVLYLGDGTRRSSAALNVGVISTVAGGGWVPGAGIGDGLPATQAELFHPYRVAVAPERSYYIADVNNYRVRRVDAGGIITTVAGTATFGYNGDNIPATSAQLNNPEDVALGGDGSLYIADRSNNRIRRVRPDGIITTLAGNGAACANAQQSCGDGGPAAAAQLGGPYGVAAAPDGSIYIADTDDQRVRRVGPDGVISTVAGTGVWGFSGDGGPAALSRLGNPRSVAVGADGALYIADWSNNRIRRVGTDGIIRTIAGSTASSGYAGDGGPALSAQFCAVAGVSVGPDDSVYVVDECNNRVRRIGPDGIIVTVAGNGVAGSSGDGGVATGARLDWPGGTAVGPDGSLYIADRLNHLIREVVSALPGGSTSDILIASEDGSEVYVFDGGGRHLRTLNALTGATRYSFAYDSGGRLASVSDGDGNVTALTRDGAGNPTGIVAPYGQTTVLAVDANGYLSSISNPAGEVVRLATTSDGLLSTFTDARNQTYTFSYDTLGLLTRDADPAGGFQTLSRLQAGQAHTVTLSTALARTSVYGLSDLPGGAQARGNTLPSGLREDWLRASDQTVSAREPDGTRLSYAPGPDPRWGMLAPLMSTETITLPGTLRVTFGISRSASLTQTLNPFSLAQAREIATLNGRNYTETYTAATRTYTYSTPLGRTSLERIDAQGRSIMTQPSGLLPTTYTYDSRGRLTGVVQGTRAYALTYNAAGLIASITDPMGRVESYAYDAAGRLTSATLPGGRIVGYGHDANGNVTSITPPGRSAHALAYTPLNLPASYAPPAVGAVLTPTVLSYNLDRQLNRITRVDGSLIDSAYDTAGRLSTLTTARGTTGYTYDPTTGNTATISAPGSLGMSFTYDGFLQTGSTWTGTVAGAVTFTYNGDLNVASLSVDGANTIAYQYDADALLTGAGSLALRYDAQTDLLAGSTLGGVTDTLAYNGYGEVSQYLSAYGGAPQFSARYGRDGLGRISTITETIGAATDVYGYAYDAAGRLAGVTRNGASVATYTYDANGNRLTSGATSATYDAQDRLVQFGSTIYTFTPDGALLTKTSGGQTTQYQYDALGNLLAVSLPGGTNIAYLIDGQNRRIGKKVNNTLTQGFLYEDQLRIAAELDGSNNVVSRFVYASRGNVPDYMIRGAVTYRLIADHLGSPRLVVNVATGAIAQRIDYDAFGNVLNDSNPGFQPFGFAGGLYDPQTRLVRFGARDYDADTGRWTAKDPLWFDGGDTNLYAYVGNDPLNWQDADGGKASPSLGNDGYFPVEKTDPPGLNPSCSAPEPSLWTRIKWLFGFGHGPVIMQGRLGGARG